MSSAGIGWRFPEMIVSSAAGKMRSPRGSGCGDRADGDGLDGCAQSVGISKPTMNLPSKSASIQTGKELQPARASRICWAARGVSSFPPSCSFSCITFGLLLLTAYAPKLIAMRAAGIGQFSRVGALPSSGADLTRRERLPVWRSGSWARWGSFWPVQSSWGSIPRTRPEWRDICCKRSRGSRWRIPAFSACPSDFLQPSRGRCSLPNQPRRRNSTSSPSGSTPDWAQNQRKRLDSRPQR